MTVHSEPTAASTPPPRSAANAAATLGSMAPLVQAVLVVLGLVSVAGELWALDPRRATSPGLAALVHLGEFVLAGWVARRLLAALAALLELFDAIALAAARLAVSNDRLADTLIRTPLEAAARPGASAASLASESAASEARTMALAEIRVALKKAEWDQAEALIETFSDNHQDDHAVAPLRNDLKAARQSAAAALRVRLDAAREAKDPDRVLEHREALAPLLEPEERVELDRGLARWFMALIQKRLRPGVMTLDLAVLASRVASAFDSTPEGASLRAALPTLRRSVGLCARCGQPYTGLADACPACLGTAQVPVFIPPPDPPQNGGPPRSFDEEVSEATDLEPE